MSARKHFLHLVMASSVIVGLPVLGHAQCASRSPLSCAAVPVTLPYQLGWSASEGGIVDGSAVGTGFTVAEPHTSNFDPAVPSNPALNGYEPSMLSVDTVGSVLKITTSRGIMYRHPAVSANTNSLVNGLGVGVSASGTKLRIETVLKNLPAATNSAEQAGLWFWLDEDNYVKLTAISTGTTNYKVQLLIEDYPPTATGFPATSAAPFEINTGNVITTSSTPKLILIIDYSTSSITGKYDVGAGEVLVGSFPQSANAAGSTTTCTTSPACPTPGAEFFTGVDHDANGGTPSVSFAGVYATQRNNTTISPRLVYSFDSFLVRQFCSTAADCNDGNLCTTDSCDGTGTCIHTNNALACDDGLFCNGADTCSGGSCGAHAGDPCLAGLECNNVCNEAADNCAVTAGTGCTNDGNVCTNDVCDGIGACTHPNNTAPCDDSLFCNGVDTCSGGTCTHAGDPCAAGLECNNVCNEAADNCAVTAGTGCTNDGNVCTNDSCDGAGVCAHPNNTAPCNDSDACTASDVCSGGSCGGTPLGGQPCDTGALGACMDGTTVCLAGVVTCPQTVQPTDEVCTNGIDEDCNGEADDGPGCAITCTPGNTFTLNTQTKRTSFKFKGIADGDKVSSKGAFVLPQAVSIAPDTEVVSIGVTDGVDTVYVGTIPSGLFVNTRDVKYKFKDSTRPYEHQGLQSAQLSIKSDGITVQFKFKARDIDLPTPGNGAGSLVVKIGDKCFVDGNHTCVVSISGTSAKCQ